LGWVLDDGNVARLLTETGPIGPIVFVVVMWVTQPFGVPGFVYMVPAGIVWPAPVAIAVSWVGNMGSSYLGFSFARWFARDWVKARIPPRMHVFDDRLADGGIMPVIGLRLVFGQLPPADWLPGVVIAVVAGGGIVGELLDLPPIVQVVAIGAAGAIAPLVVRRLRNRRAADVVG
jgi:uncharacterized membrane protein YdjX (TVP38/TMEM64 family)